MDCQICEAHFEASRKLTCPACLRSSLYPYRVDLAKTLLNKESLGKQVERHLRGGVRDGTGSASQRSERWYQRRVENAQPDAAHLQLRREVAGQDAAAARDRVGQIAFQAESLRQRMQDYEKELKSRKASLEARRSALASHRTALRDTQQSNVQQSRQAADAASERVKTLYRNDVVQTRTDKIREAASLVGIQQRERLRRPERGLGFTASPYHRYFIHGTPILDLRDINNADPALLTESFTHVARLLVLACYYLGVRLPAEIVLPHAGYPFPTIYAPTSSYMQTSVSLRFVNPYRHPPPGTGTPAYSHAELEKLGGARARPLFASQKLTELAKEDAMGYSLLVEGAALLAWDIAWVCRSQGVPIAEKDWLEICAIGRNMYQLLILAPRTRPSLSRRHISDKSQDVKDHHVVPSDSNGISYATFSHASADTFLRAHAAYAPDEVAPLVDASKWKFVSYINVKDRIKSYLQAEMSGAEWEMLEADEYGSAAADDVNEDASGKHSKQRDGNQLIANEGSSTPAKTSGWTKVKERPPPSL
ncbi:MAG: hypothetical protein M1828_005347 [Chrysothrix sp. TS-e1954]|nr:MAG: hypothetical protein M1828_005347 [Chrysothrix sp. TS-e1954]